MSITFRLAQNIMKENKKIFWRLNSFNPVYSDEDIMKEFNIPRKKVRDMRDDFLMCYKSYSENVGTNEFYNFLDKARYEEERA